MQSSVNFSGIWIPNITPFKKNDVYKVDFEALGELIDYLINTQKADGIVPCGTTGESNTMTTAEDQRVADYVIEHINGRVPIMVGTGTNDTRATVSMTQYAENAGADAALVVVPYYNRPDQRGIYEHFATIARNTALPLFIYNIPARTGRNAEPETITKLAHDFNNIYGIKDVACDLEQTAKLIQLKNELNRPFYVLGGEDAMIYKNLEMGGDGAISASAHLVGAEMKKMVEAYQTNNPEEGEKIHHEIDKMFNLLFAEPNPAPIKACYDLLGLSFGGELRLPLIKASTELRSKLKNELQQLGKL